MTAIPIADSHPSSKAIFQMAPVALTIIFAYVIPVLVSAAKKKGFL